MIRWCDVTFMTIALQFVQRGSRARATMAHEQDRIQDRPVALQDRNLPGVDSSNAGLNKEGVDRWRLSQIVLPSTMWGRANTMVAILDAPSPA